MIILQDIPIVLINLVPLLPVCFIFALGDRTHQVRFEWFGSKLSRPLRKETLLRLPSPRLSVRDRHGWIYAARNRTGSSLFKTSCPESKQLHTDLTSLLM